MMRSIKMVVLLVLALSFVLSIAGCGRKGDMVRPDAPEAPAAEMAPMEMPAADAPEAPAAQ